jgi:hypothetical protein
MKAKRKVARKAKARSPYIISEKELDKLLEAMQRRMKEKRERLVPVMVEFPSGSKFYTYLVPKDHRLTAGDKVVTPTGPAHVVRVDGIPLMPDIAYKKLVAKFVRVDFDYA